MSCGENTEKGEMKGDQTAADWITNGLIVAPEVGCHIEASVDGLGRTHFVAIPEPGTFGLFAGLGGALLFVRKKLSHNLPIFGGIDDPPLYPLAKRVVKWILSLLAFS